MTTNVDGSVPREVTFPEGECRHGTPFRYACEECEGEEAAAPREDPSPIAGVKGGGDAQAQ